MRRRPLFTLLSLAIALALVAALFPLLGITPVLLGAALARTPAWLLAAVLALTLANQLAGTLRWRLAAAWLAPEVPLPSPGAMLKATVWGAFIGQLVPPQIGMSAARWAAQRHHSAIGATLYEQLFDLVILGSGALAAMAVLLLGTGGALSFAIFGATILAGCLSLRWTLAIGHRLAGLWGTGRWPGATLAARFAPALAQAARAPVPLLAAMCGWSLVRLACLSLRMLAVAWAFAPGFAWPTVLVGYPLVGLSVAVPVLPAGLGLADWSWTGLLVLAGASASAAGITAILFRLLNFAALAALLLMLWPLAGAPRNAVRAASA